MGKGRHQRKPATEAEAENEVSVLSPAERKLLGRKFDPSARKSSRHDGEYSDPVLHQLRILEEFGEAEHTGAEIAEENELEKLSEQPWTSRQGSHYVGVSDSSDDEEDRTRKPDEKTNFELKLEKVAELRQRRLAERGQHAGAGALADLEMALDDDDDDEGQKETKESLPVDSSSFRNENGLCSASGLLSKVWQQENPEDEIELTEILLSVHPDLLRILKCWKNWLKYYKSHVEPRNYILAKFMTGKQKSLNEKYKELIDLLYYSVETFTYLFSTGTMYLALVSGGVETVNHPVLDHWKRADKLAQKVQESLRSKKVKKEIKKLIDEFEDEEELPEYEMDEDDVDEDQKYLEDENYQDALTDDNEEHQFESPIEDEDQEVEEDEEEAENEELDEDEKELIKMLKRKRESLELAPDASFNPNSEEDTDSEEEEGRQDEDDEFDGLSETEEKKKKTTNEKGNRNKKNEKGRSGLDEEDDEDEEFVELPKISAKFQKSELIAREKKKSQKMAQQADDDQVEDFPPEENFDDDDVPDMSEDGDENSGDDLNQSTDDVSDEEDGEDKVGSDVESELEDDEDERKKEFVKEIYSRSDLSFGQKISLLAERLQEAENQKSENIAFDLEAKSRKQQKGMMKLFAEMTRTDSSDIVKEKIESELLLADVLTRKGRKETVHKSLKSAEKSASKLRMQEVMKPKLTESSASSLLLHSTSKSSSLARLVKKETEIPFGVQLKAKKIAKRNEMRQAEEEENFEAVRQKEEEELQYEKQREMKTALKIQKRKEWLEKRAQETLPPPDETIDPTQTKRVISKTIEKNRGLTRWRKKYAGNARMSNKLKYDKKMKQLAKMRPALRTAEGSGSYAGEERGILPNVVRSQLLH